ncbi:type II toxin-antitoxin system RelE/ParE family toxin [Agrobacterium rhizogenes]|uniref:type II toxin-antitoxin system RelE/ParE family toxin n=1 Tax=Rhizobium rhizogenes TaxID=359 RepID=UPI001572F1BE|nr:type II toxin-antitoxin system RelE/ParE family toxin [Rhizobium rhizogenes]NTH79008.1 type II toxin-antitoxin system RelE/ParE family toxin [Rhizobium rhizogenes]NTH85013.1 type II toxin-antitoxin system RelE/ParE family toxin [Rhizobium rhizogenes]
MDAKKIYIEIGKEQPLAAERFFQQFRYKANLLADHLRLGEQHSEIFGTAHMLVEAPYITLYETFADADESEIHMVEIVQVVDGRRDLTTLF